MKIYLVKAQPVCQSDNQWVERIFDNRGKAENFIYLRHIKESYAPEYEQYIYFIDERELE